MATIKHLPVTAPANKIINEIESNGAVIIDGFLSTETLGQFNAEIKPGLEEKPTNHTHPNAAVEFFHGPQTKQLTSAIGGHVQFVSLVALSEYTAGPNKTDRIRRGMHTSFCLGWLRTEENSSLSAPLKRVREMPRRAQELLGYGVHDGIAKGEGFLGAVDNGIPVDMIAAGTI